MKENVKKNVGSQCPVSEVQFIPIQPRDGLLGFCSFVWDNKLKLSGIGIHSKPNGDIRLVFPGNKHGQFVFPLTSEVYSLITTTVSKQVSLILGLTNNSIYTSHYLRGGNND